ncbi:hypothetical protein KUTeg_006876 [Tegillarca granosa]|uniref:Uncharacterized protein n=1 Tax=Tegillarca granosa TaxID=220873 RepID=A0ABQ9FET9_TEGGR|nr:hypothetical protein KUTeg_006876 [Tegillarca granosa]
MLRTAIITCCISILIGSETEMTFERSNDNTLRCSIKAPHGNASSTITIKHPPGNHLGYCLFNNTSQNCDNFDNNLTFKPYNMWPTSLMVKVLTKTGHWRNGIYECQYKDIKKSITITDTRNNGSNLKYDRTTFVTIVLLLCIINFALL